MSEQYNVQTINEIYDAFGRGDVPAIVDKVTDDVSWSILMEPVIPWSGDYSGKKRVPAFFDAIFQNAIVESFNPLEYIAQGDVVVSIGTFGCKSKATGKSTLTRWVFIWRFRNGKVSSYEQFHDPRIADAFRP